MSDNHGFPKDMVAGPGDTYVAIFRYDKDMKKVFVEGMSFDASVGICGIAEALESNSKEK